MNLSFDELRAANTARCEQVYHPLNDWSVTDWACAMAGEAGEACNVAKKIRRRETGTRAPNDPNTLEECHALLAAELADTVIYCDLLAARLDINLGNAIRKKFNRTSERMKSDVRL